MNLKQEKRRKENTDGMLEYFITFPPHVEKSKKKLFIEEIGWCINTTASAFQRKQLPLPYYEEIQKPAYSLFGIF
jgi:hypothetical protein